MKLNMERHCDNGGLATTQQYHRAKVRCDTAFVEHYGLAKSCEVHEYVFLSSFNVYINNSFWPFDVNLDSTQPKFYNETQSHGHRHIQKPRKSMTPEIKPYQIYQFNVLLYHGLQ